MKIDHKILSEYNECKYWHKCPEKKVQLCVSYPEICRDYKIFKKQCKEVNL